MKEEICSLIEGFSLPEQYVGCQIRGGDKFIEYDLLSVDLYLRKIKEVTDLKNVFVLTDDYEIIKCLRKMHQNIIGSHSANQMRKVIIILRFQKQIH